MAQWVQLYETYNEALPTILAAFSVVFPPISIWMGVDSDLILIGSAKPGVYGLGKYGRTFFPAAHSRAFRVGERASLPSRPNRR